MQFEFTRHVQLCKWFGGSLDPLLVHFQLLLTITDYNPQARFVTLALYYIYLKNERNVLHLVKYSLTFQKRG